MPPETSTECYPISLLHPTRLYQDFPDQETAAPDAPIRGWYGTVPTGRQWLHSPAHAPANAPALADALETQCRTFEASSAVFRNIDLLRNGARAVVTGQQVGLFGGPLLTLLKAATAIARAAEATRATGIPHVPIFWLATEDHDLAEVDQATFLRKSTIETLHAHLRAATAEPVGQVTLPPEITPVLDGLAELLDSAPEADLLRDLYAPGQTLGRAFARLITHLFAAHGLIVLDASTPEFHHLGASTLRSAIKHADELEDALLARTRELESAGFHAQVKVAPDMSLLFLISDLDGKPDRQALRRTPEGAWKAGRQTYTTADLLAILESAPERISPNALLRPVLQVGSTHVVP